MANKQLTRHNDTEALKGNLAVSRVYIHETIINFRKLVWDKSDSLSLLSLCLTLGVRE